MLSCQQTIELSIPTLSALTQIRTTVQNNSFYICHFGSIYINDSADFVHAFSFFIYLLKNCTIDIRKGKWFIIKICYTKTCWKKKSHIITLSITGYETVLWIFTTVDYKYKKKKNIGSTTSRCQQC